VDATRLATQIIELHKIMQSDKLMKEVERRITNKEKLQRSDQDSIKSTNKRKSPEDQTPSIDKNKIKTIITRIR